MFTALQLLPAVDVVEGRAVQLVQGDLGTARGFGDPVEAALRWQRAGATWVHLADLDAAFGRGSNSDVVAEVVSRLDIDVQVSGGIADEASLRAALATGCRRVVLGTAALRAQRWVSDAIAHHGDRVAVGIDVRGTTLAPRGGTNLSTELPKTIEWLERAGCARYVVTDVRKDGTLEGPNLDLLRDVCARTNAAVIASGGVATLDDIAALTTLVPIGVEGAVVGTALHTGALDLSAGLALAADLASRAEEG
jgi:phosphoribosylanthranilate isomerase